MTSRQEMIAALIAEYPVLTKQVNGKTHTLKNPEYQETIKEWADSRLDREEKDALRISGGPHTDYALFRAEEYPSIQDQLDLQYWDAINGTTIWVDTITAIKQKYQKPV